MDDKALIRSVLNGKTDDFNILVSRYTGQVYRLCLSLCGNGFDADDAAQETFIDAFLYLPSLSDAEKFLPWLYSIARRKSYRQRSTRRTDADIDEMSEYLPSAEGSPDDAILYLENSNRISQALAKLPATKRTVARVSLLPVLHQRVNRCGKSGNGEIR